MEVYSNRITKDLSDGAKNILLAFILHEIGEHYFGNILPTAAEVEEENDLTSYDYNRPDLHLVFGILKDLGFIKPYSPTLPLRRALERFAPHKKDRVGQAYRLTPEGEALLDSMYDEDKEDEEEEHCEP